MMESGGSRERRPIKTSDTGLKSQGEVGWGLGSRSGGEKSRAKFCSQLWQTHLAFAPLTSRVHLVLGWRKQAVMRGSCGRAAGSHLFCFQHQRPKKRLSSPEGHDHPSWRLRCQEARSLWPASVHSACRMAPFPAHFQRCSFGNFPSRQALIPAQGDRPPERKTGAAEAKRKRLMGTRLTVPKVGPKHVKFYLITEGSHLAS